MLETKVIVLGIISALFVIGWSILGLAGGFSDEKPPAKAEAE